VHCLQWWLKSECLVFLKPGFKDEHTTFELHCTLLAVHGEVFQIHGTGKGKCQPGKQRQQHHNGPHQLPRGDPANPRHSAYPTVSCVTGPLPAHSSGVTSSSSIPLTNKVQLAFCHKCNANFQVVLLVFQDLSSLYPSKYKVKNLKLMRNTADATGWLCVGA